LILSLLFDYEVYALENTFYKYEKVLSVRVQKLLNEFKTLIIDFGIYDFIIITWKNLLVFFD